MPTSSKFVLLRVEIFFSPTSILPLSPSLALPLLPPSSHFLSFPHLRSFTLSPACFFPSIFSASSPHFLHSPLSPFLLFFFFLCFPFLSFPFFSFPQLSLTLFLLICSVCTDRRALHRQQWFILLRQMSVAYSMLLPFCFISTHCT